MARLKNFGRPGARYRIRGLLLDSDLRGDNHNRDERAVRLAEKNRIELIWQVPVHEAFILRHFKGFETHRPPDKRLAERQLRRVWPEYERGMDATGYERMLELGHLQRVRIVEAEFDAFLTSMGWR